VVHGFGIAGSVAARLLHEAGVRVLGVWDSRCSVAKKNGLAVPALIQHKELTGSVAGFPGADEIGTEDLLSLPCDVLVPAALESSIHAGNAGKVKAKIIAEAANGPLTPEADRVLDAAGAFVIPDILCNAGGVTVSYFEWVQNEQHLRWSEADVNGRLEEVMTRSFQDVLEISRTRGVRMRTAATMLGVSRVARAAEMRGLYP
jgi:glutamate dehydrogenase/leucine dehydrogenase